MMHHWDAGWGVGNWLFMGFGMLIFWTLVVAVIVWVVRSSGGRRTGQPAPEDYRTRRDTLAGR